MGRRGGQAAVRRGEEAGWGGSTGWPRREAPFEGEVVDVVERALKGGGQESGK